MKVKYEKRKIENMGRIDWEDEIGKKGNKWIKKLWKKDQYKFSIQNFTNNAYIKILLVTFTPSTHFIKDFFFFLKNKVNFSSLSKKNVGQDVQFFQVKTVEICTSCPTLIKKKKKKNFNCI